MVVHSLFYKENCEYLITFISNSLIIAPLFSSTLRLQDRPSIEIYQPRKMRIPSLTGKDTSGRSSTELKDYKSNPTSDCESIKMERDEKANAKRKVSRYSERRSDRAKGRMSKDRESKDVDVPQTKQAEPAEEKGVDVKSES